VVGAADVTRPVGAAGASRTGCLLGILILIVGGYVAVLVAGSEIDYRQLASEVQRQAGLAAEREDQDIREAIAARVGDLQLPAAAGQATIRRFPENRIQIIIQYPDPIDFFGQWQWVRTRRIQIDQTY
jgi:hypothetical protein